MQHNHHIGVKYLDNLDEYNKVFTPGIYNCIVCNIPLFTSETKFDSGCGWPAFYD